MLNKTLMGGLGCKISTRTNKQKYYLLDSSALYEAVTATLTESLAMT